MSADWITRTVMATDNALSRKFTKLRDAADHSMVGSPAFVEFGRLYDELQATPQERWSVLLKQAEAEEQAAQQGVSA
jgi:hypothetical protein